MKEKVATVEKVVSLDVKETIESLKKEKWLYPHFVEALESGKWLEMPEAETEELVEQKLFAAEPLAPLSREEENILKKIAVKNLAFFANREEFEFLADEIYLGAGWTDEWPFLFTPDAKGKSREPLRELAKEEKLKLFFDPVFWASCYLTYKNIQTPLTGYGNRPVTEYAWPKEELDRRVERADKPLAILDIGSGMGMALHDLKEMYGKKVETHGFAAEQEVAMFPVDYQHYGLAERLPAEFKNKFDFIFSNMAFRYFAFQNIALRNVVKSLKTGGLAELAFSYERGSDDQDSYDDYFLKKTGKEDHYNAMKILVADEFKKLRELEKNEKLMVETSRDFQGNGFQGVVRIHKLADFEYDQ